MVYICGNPDMILNVERELMDRGFPEFHVKKELYWPKGKAPRRPRRAADRRGSPARPYPGDASLDRSAAQTRGADIGSSRGRTPAAAAMALAMAAGPARIDASPIPLAPNGPSGAGTSTMSVSIGGSIDALGTA